MRKTHLLRALCAVTFSFITLPANAALLGVLPATPDGTDYQAYYDTQLDITWAANAQINGITTWENQMAWADTLTIGGVSGWRLPDVDVDGDDTIIVACSSDQAACLDNEYGHLYWYGAGTTFGSGITKAAFGPFNITGGLGYWSSTEFEPDTSYAWSAGVDFGGTTNNGKGNMYYAWAVFDGNAGLVIPVEVEIDIKPGQVGNWIHPHHNGDGTTPVSTLLDDTIEVGVLGSWTLVGDPIDFAVGDIDPATIRFGPAQGAYDPSTTPDLAANVDSDGINDATFDFLTGDVGISCGETEATLTGETTIGQLFEGTDIITTQCNALCH
jgi:hypothetical protein